MDIACRMNGEKNNERRVLVGRPEGKRPIGKPKSKCVDNNKIYLRQRTWGGMGWIDLAQDRD
jgi:hypothetical protein